jgi:hypothetical protein
LRPRPDIGRPDNPLELLDLAASVELGHFLRLSRQHLRAHHLGQYPDRLGDLRIVQRILRPLRDLDFLGARLAKTRMYVDGSFFRTVATTSLPCASQSSASASRNAADIRSRAPFFFARLGLLAPKRVAGL